MELHTHRTGGTAPATPDFVLGIYETVGQKNLPSAKFNCGVFIAALIFRTIDDAICQAFPVGTHFLRHLSTAVALLLATKALIVNLSPLKTKKRRQ